MLDIVKAHALCSYHKKSVLKSSSCGCFCCCTFFSPILIKEWIDEDETALCPNCSIDSVLPQDPQLELTEEFLKQMNEHWFSIKSSI